MAVKNIHIDPITRIEGHLKANVQIEDGQVTDAWLSGGMYRGFETILKDRDPRDAPQITQRICGVCPVSHALVSAMALENAANFTPSKEAILCRNLMQGANFLQSHILSFYHLSGQDFLQGPDTAPFIPRYADPDLRLNARENSLGIDEYLEALNVRRTCHEMVALFGGRMPHVQGIVAGGVTDMPNKDKVTEFAVRLKEVKRFVAERYIPLTFLIASKYPDLCKVGQGYGTAMSMGVFPAPQPGASQDTSLQNKSSQNASAPNLSPQNTPSQDSPNQDSSRQDSSHQDSPRQSSSHQDSSLAKGSFAWLFGSGVWYDNKDHDFDPEKIVESVRYSWFGADSGGNIFTAGIPQVNPNKAEAYSFSMAPRYDGHPMEVGPHARMWINDTPLSTVSQDMARQYLNISARTTREMGKNFLFSLMGRHVARAEECAVIISAMEKWLAELAVSPQLSPNAPTEESNNADALAAFSRSEKSSGSAQQSTSGSGSAQQSASGAGSVAEAASGSAQQSASGSGSESPVKSDSQSGLVFGEMTIPQEAEGYACTEAPRGSLLHYIRVSNGVIDRYRILPATLWNCSPRDDSGQRGPMEEALVHIPVPKEDSPVNVARLIRSFDP